MGFYQFKRKLIVNTTINDLWNFIATPANLKRITPEYMGFDITSEDLPEKMYEGMIISYQVSPVFGLKTTWVTEITKLKEKQYFIDEQRIGPYKMWHHQHFIEPSERGVLMTDIVSYQPPFGILGNVANTLLIRKKLIEIFEFRTKALQRIFEK